MNSSEEVGDLLEKAAALAELQCGVVGVDGIALVGTGAYRQKVGTRRPRGCYFTRAKTLKGIHIIRAPSEACDCASCEAKDTCPYSVVLCAPVVKRGEVIGVAGLLGQGEAINDAVLRDKERWAAYLNNLAASFSRFSYISDVLEARSMSDETLQSVFRLDKRQGLIIAGGDRRIVRVNEVAKDLLGYSPEQVDFNQLLTDVLPDQVLEQLYTQKLAQVSAYLRQNNRLVAVSRADSEFLRLGGNGIAIALGELRPGRTAPGREKQNGIKALERIIGNDLNIRNVKQIISRMADLPLPILIQGESGTGKELVAEAIHDVSDRREKAMVALNCAAIPENLLESELFGYERGAFTGAAACGKKGLLEVADGSTLFLDEIGDMSLASQAKLLRVLEQKQFYRLGGQKPVRVDVRIVAATNVPLEAMVQQKKFREDLYYRLNVVPILLRPLREREDDILLLAECFLMEHIPPDAPDGRWEMTDEVSELLENYAWPGNIRELRNAVGYMAAMARSGVLSRDCLPEHLLRCARAQAQKGPTAEEIRAALDAFGRSTEGKKRAAEHLGMSLPTLYRMIKKLGVT